MAPAGFFRVALLAHASLSYAVDENVFAGNAFFVNPSYQTHLDTSIATASDAATKKTLQTMREMPSAYWIDIKAKITGKDDTDTLEGILYAASLQAEPPLVVAVMYDLPNRDCGAKSSNGEICCHYNDDSSCNYTGFSECVAGLTEYKTEYIDECAKVIAQYDGIVPIALLIEPDSLPNLVTNMGLPNCGNGATEAAYQQGITYAVKTLKAACPACQLYLDAAHAGWLGWNINKFVAAVVELDVMVDVRGFSTNVANYWPLGKLCPWDLDCALGGTTENACCEDPCSLLTQGNYGNNELNYAKYLIKQVAKATGELKHAIIDTGRNGVVDMRSHCPNWCNIRGAGVGRVPTADTANTSFVDAYFWLKTPGESDGCTEDLPWAGDAYATDAKCVRYDSACATNDSLGSDPSEPYAPEAGHWFDYQVQMLAKNAVMYTDGGYSPTANIWQVRLVIVLMAGYLAS